MKSFGFISSTVAMMVTAFALTSCGCDRDPCCEPAPRVCAPKPCCPKPCPPKPVCRPCPQPEPMCY